MKQDALVIGGKLVPSRGKEILEVFSPATEELIGTVPLPTVDDMNAAVRTARDAFDSGDWPRTPVKERIEAVLRLADEVERHAEELVKIVVSEVGVPIAHGGAGQVYGVPMLLRAMASMAERFPYVEDRSGSFGHTLVVHEPVGVVGAIIPWNGPLFVTMLKLGPALLAGCATVVKPAPETPLDGYVLAECLRAAGIPEGVVSIVPADREVGEALVRHPGVDKISFTGSTAAGKRIAAICGESIRRCTLELGGKSAAIFLPDGDLSRLIPAVVGSALGTNGQQCYGLTRILAPRGRYEEVVDALTEATGALKIGDPFDSETQMGPLISERQRSRVEEYIRSGLEEGARLTVGGERPPGIERGWYLEPTVFADVQNSMRIAQEEIFGPVLAVIPFEGVDDAVRIANESKYGLSGAVFTSDEELGIEIGRRVRTGTFTVGGFTMNFEAPFGGFKESGMGREYGPEGLASCTEVKSIHLLPT
jgi:aldehyde dehydrogenase (NAD+)